MEFNQILKMQIEMDELHGFPVEFASQRDKYDQLTKDLVGLVGEIGEFSNIVKKINIKLDRPDEYDLNVSMAEALLPEELADGLIYIIRIAAILKIDLQAELVKKIQQNVTRYEKLQRE